jgi:hypothetical protein
VWFKKQFPLQENRLVIPAGSYKKEADPTLELKSDDRDSGLLPIFVFYFSLR